LEQSLPEIKAVLLNVPNLVAVGIGYKESNNIFTKEIAYNGKVFVWFGVRKTTGRGEGSSGLGFDRILAKGTSTGT
jgi:hypothetical protein